MESTKHNQYDLKTSDKLRKLILPENHSKYRPPFAEAVHVYPTDLYEFIANNHRFPFSPYAYRL